jgi:primase-like protein
VAGEPIPETTRNNELTRIAGRLHDGARSLEDLTADLEAINAARCAPPLEASEVARIAASIHRRKPCRGKAPEVTPAVRAKVDYLESVERPVKGMAGGSGWSIYRAGLRLARRYGREHPDGVALSVDTRTWALEAGSGRSTVSRFVQRSPLVRLVRRGEGRRSSVVVFVTPRGVGHKLGHSNHRGGT